MFMINFNLKLIILIRLKLTLSLYKQYKNKLFRKKKCNLHATYTYLREKLIRKRNKNNINKNNKTEFQDII